MLTSLEEMLFCLLDNCHDTAISSEQDSLIIGQKIIVINIQIAQLGTQHIIIKV